MKQLPCVLRAFESHVRLVNVDDRVQVAVGRSHILKITKVGQKVQHKRDRYEVEKRVQDILLSFLEEVLRG